MTDPMDNLRQASADVSGVEVLSPAGQAVLQAFDDARDGEYMDGEWVINERAMLAAALRAAALLLQEAYANESYPGHPDDFLIDLAGELEGQDQLTKESD